MPQPQPYICIAPHGWGRGATITEARTRAAQFASHMNEYIIYLLPGPDPALYWVSEIDGALQWRNDQPTPVRVRRRYLDGKIDREHVPAVDISATLA
jgi:hypothetical protein